MFMYYDVSVNLLDKQCVVVCANMLNTHSVHDVCMQQKQVKPDTGTPHTQTDTH